MTRKPPRLLIEEWLPAAAIGVECIRERSTGQQPPDKRLHVWWARRPLVASRAAVLASLLPADFPRDVFERLLGFGRPGKELVEVRRLMDTRYRVDGGFNCDRAFKRALRDDDLDLAQKTASKLWGSDITVIDPMAGGGSIPLESARVGFRVYPLRNRRGANVHLQKEVASAIDSRIRTKTDSHLGKDLSGTEQ